MKVSIDKRNDDDILYQGSIIEFEFDYLKDISEFVHENPHN